jgi:1,4-dihydroxy-2-naphthoyl-CoA synthase
MTDMAAPDRYGFTYIRTELADDGVLRVTLDRPERRNAISPEMHDELTPLFRRIAEDREVRVAVLTGAGERRSASAPTSAGWTPTSSRATRTACRS